MNAPEDNPNINSELKRNSPLEEGAPETIKGAPVATQSKEAGIPQAESSGGTEPEPSEVAPAVSQSDLQWKECIKQTLFSSHNLGEGEMNTIISKTLGLPPETAVPLCSIVYHKTKGNPGLFSELMVSLTEAGLLKVCPRNHRWVWDKQLEESREPDDHQFKKTFFLGIIKLLRLPQDEENAWHKLTSKFDILPTCLSDIFKRSMSGREKHNNIIIPNKDHNIYKEEGLAKQAKSTTEPARSTAKRKADENEELRDLVKALRAENNDLRDEIKHLKATR